jgi:hypothetical protein
MQAVLEDISNGAFAQRFIDDQDAGGPEFAELRMKGETHPIEQTGGELRKLMAWVKSHDSDYVEGTLPAEATLAAPTRRAAPRTDPGNSPALPQRGGVPTYFTSERRSISRPTTRGTTIHIIVVAPSWDHSRAEDVCPSKRAACV